MGWNATPVMNPKMAPQLSIVHGSKERPLLHMTLGQVADETERKYGSHAFLNAIFERKIETFSQYNTTSKTIAKSLLSLKISHSDHVGIFLPNCSKHLEIFLGAAHIGAPVISLNLTFSPDELARAVGFTKCKIVFICSSVGAVSFDKHIEKLRASTAPTKIVVIDSPTEHGSEAFLNLATNVTSTDLSKASSIVTPEDILNIQFTSGTTGMPKAAMLTHKGLVNQAHVAQMVYAYGPQDKILGMAPLFHVFGSIGSIIFPLVSGCSVILPSPLFDAAACLSAIQTTSPTFTMGVPTMYLAIAELVSTRSLVGRLPASIRYAFVAGSPVSTSMRHTMREVLNIAFPVAAFGLTEASMGTHGLVPTDSSATCDETLGRVWPHTSARIVAHNDPSRILPRGQRGELLIAGYGVFPGYYAQAEKTREAIFVDVEEHGGTRWLRTGDEGFFDDQGYLVITGRVKDIIIRGGENIYPAEIEARLAELPSVAEACVVGMPDTKYGEVVAAFLRPRDGEKGEEAADVEDEAVREWVREKLARQKAPKYVFWLGTRELPTVFPRTGSGKLQKHRIKEFGTKLLAASGNNAPKKARL
jgi:mevalonyl-CoA ligase